MAKLIEISDDKRGGFSHIWQCPACGNGHVANFDPERTGPLWNLSGSLEKPTITPSILVHYPREKGGEIKCHVYITDGQIQYLSDCTHDMAGQTIPMEDW
jgi:hypothetical protein